MTLEEIMKLIEEDVKVDIYGDLYGHDRVAEILMYEITSAESRGYFRAMKDVRDGTVEKLNSM